jgi:hypothetical protein
MFREFVKKYQKQIVLAGIILFAAFSYLWFNRVFDYEKAHENSPIEVWSAQGFVRDKQENEYFVSASVFKDHFASFAWYDYAKKQHNKMRFGKDDCEYGQDVKCQGFSWLNLGGNNYRIEIERGDIVYRLDIKAKGERRYLAKSGQSVQLPQSNHMVNYYLFPNCLISGAGKTRGEESNLSGAGIVEHHWSESDYFADYSGYRKITAVLPGDENLLVLQFKDKKGKIHNLGSMYCKENEVMYPENTNITTKKNFKQDNLSWGKQVIVDAELDDKKTEFNIELENDHQFTDRGVMQAAARYSGRSGDRDVSGKAYIEQIHFP